ncbi:hypothetical protein [uncultured Clostridium sp.]|uniref:hypothetical protein n=1 Tax=uncultured Clostridium sp. TaxID=59620 RepID=UPI002671A186|nr:hypothetical protein [uncultured Clostridium sp.]
MGPFFRMNNLSQDEINTQLFFFAKEAIRTIVLESKCGLVSSIKSYKRLSSNNDISINSNISPLLCVYKKASPNYIHSKNSNGFDEDTFRKEINPTSNALMTLSILELADYYDNFKDKDRNLYAFHDIYKKLAKEQLEFYSVNLRSTDGTFTSKKNNGENNYKNFNLSDKDKKFKFSDQAYMMLAYYLYSLKNPESDVYDAYKAFAMEILQVFVEFKDKIYETSLDEICKILLAFNVLYSYDDLDDLKLLIIDFADYAMNKLDEKDYYVEELDTVCLCSIALSLSYKHTNILGFFDKTSEIINKLYDLYDAKNEAFYKLSSKKDIKYSCFDINFYFLAFVIYSDINENKSSYKDLISSIYKKFFISSGIITSWPEAPTLDDYERYRGYSLKSTDMLNETYFKMSNIPTPSSSGTAPIFIKYVNYNKKKDEFTTSHISFDSYKNFFLFYLFIFFFKDQCINNLYNSSYGTDPFPLNKETIPNIDTIIESNPMSDEDISDKENKNNISNNPTDLSENIDYKLNNSSADILSNDIGEDYLSYNDITREEDTEDTFVVDEKNED